MRTSPRHPLADYLVVVLNRPRFARLIIGRFLPSFFDAEAFGGDENGCNPEYSELHNVSDHSLRWCFTPCAFTGNEARNFTVRG